MTGVERATAGSTAGGPAGMDASRTSGFSLLEILIVMAILALAGALALPLLTSGDPVRVEVVAEEVAAALRHARSEALRTREVHGVRVVPPPGRVRVFKANLAGGGVAVDAVLAHPLTGQPYEFRIDRVPQAGGVEMRNASSSFQYVGLAAKRSEVVFDAEGLPGFLSAGSWHSLASGTVELGYADHARSVALSVLGRVQVQ